LGAAGSLVGEVVSDEVIGVLARLLVGPDVVNVVVGTLVRLFGIAVVFVGPIVGTADGDSIKLAADVGPAVPVLGRDIAPLVGPAATRVPVDYPVRIAGVVVVGLKRLRTRIRPPVRPLEGQEFGERVLGELVGTSQGCNGD
jgi:hypothetical protein